ncbi:hypothetical protein [Micromonospora fluostatini]|uniref:hypothetical protein n=1 Tax=Micromonospora sp. JCM 30529 TaxID=3421643 RepID=UPI003D171C93
MVERVSFFDAVHGIGLRVAAGSGRSWLEQPAGDPRHAHCQVDVPGDTLLPVPEPGPRPTSGTHFLAWDDLLRFADRLAALAAPGRVGAARLDDTGGLLTVRLRRDGRLRAETTFTQGHHVTLTVRCQTAWDRHFGTRADLPGLAGQVRAAVARTRPPHPP